MERNLIPSLAQRIKYFYALWIFKGKSVQVPVPMDIKRLLDFSPPRGKTFRTESLKCPVVRTSILDRGLVEPACNVSKLLEGSVFNCVNLDRFKAVVPKFFILS